MFLMRSRALCPGCASPDSRPFADKNGFAIVQCAQCATLFTRDAVKKQYDDGYASEIEAAPLAPKARSGIIFASGATR